MDKEQLNKLRDILKGLNGSKGNLSIRDLEQAAKSFGCTWKVTKKGHQQFIAPFKEIEIVTVAIPHGKKDLGKPYVRMFINMCEAILEKELEKGGYPDD